MARDDDVQSNYSSYSDCDACSDNESEHNNELLEMFEELHSKFEIISKNYANFKKENLLLSNKHDILEK